MLTPEEYETLRLASLGLQNEEIAVVVEKCSGAIRRHMNCIYSKLGINEPAPINRYDRRSLTHRRRHEAIRQYFTGEVFYE